LVNATPSDPIPNDSAEIKTPIEALEIGEFRGILYLGKIMIGRLILDPINIERTAQIEKTNTVIEHIFPNSRGM
jgi:hypothetical protein